MIDFPIPYYIVYPGVSGYAHSVKSKSLHLLSVIGKPWNKKYDSQENKTHAKA